MKKFFWIILSLYAIHIAAQDNRIRVAVFDPTTSGVSADEGTKLAVQELISSAFVNTGDFIMVERSMIDRILKEQSFNNSDLADASQATEIGRLAGANKVVLSAVSLVGGRNMISIKLIDVQTATVEKQRAKIVDAGDLLDAVDPLVLDLLGYDTFKYTSASKKKEEKIPAKTAPQSTPVTTYTPQTAQQTTQQVVQQPIGVLQTYTAVTTAQGITIPGLGFYIAPADEVYGRDNEMTWATAQARCQQRGTGWRLPNRGELLLMWANRSYLDLDRKAGYWSSEAKKKRETYYIDWKKGKIDDDDPKDADKKCRCIKSVVGY